MSKRPPPDIQQSTGAEYADALKGVLADASHQAPGPPKPTGHRRGSKIAATVLLIVLGAPYAAWENYRYAQRPVPPSTAVQERAARVMMFSAAQAVERYRRERGTLPADLNALVLPAAEWRYVRTDTGYVLTVTLPGTSLTYRSGQDFRALLREAGVQ